MRPGASANYVADCVNVVQSTCAVAVGKRFHCLAG